MAINAKNVILSFLFAFCLLGPQAAWHGNAFTFVDRHIGSNRLLIGDQPSEPCSACEVTDKEPALYHFVRNSDYVIIGRQVEYGLVELKPEFRTKYYEPMKPGERRRLFEGGDLGRMITFEVEEILYKRPSSRTETVDFSSTRNFTLINLGNPGTGHPNFRAGGRYLLFLQEHKKADLAGVFARSTLDPSKPYFKPFRSKAIFLSEDPLLPNLASYDLNTPGYEEYLSRARDFIAAMSEPEDREKKRKLCEFYKSADDGLSANAKYAIDEGLGGTQTCKP